MAAISVLGYPGVILLMAVESACIPLPSEIVMPFAGYLTTTGRFDLLAVATAGAIGCNLGSTLAYVVGSTGGRLAVEKWGRYIMLSHKELDRVDRFFARFGAASVFLARLLPVVRTFISLPAGIARMPFWRFQIYSFVGSWLWCLVLAFVGQKLGEAWNSSPWFKSVMHTLDGAMLLAGIAAATWLVLKMLRDRSAKA